MLCRSESFAIYRKNSELLDVNITHIILRRVTVKRVLDISKIKNHLIFTLVVNKQETANRML